MEGSWACKKWREFGWLDGETSKRWPTSWCFQRFCLRFLNNVPHINQGDVFFSLLSAADLRCSAVGSLRTCRVTGLPQWAVWWTSRKKPVWQNPLELGGLVSSMKRCVIIIDYMNNKGFHTFFCIWPSQSTNVYRMSMFTKSILMTFEMFLFKQHSWI